VLQPAFLVELQMTSRELLERIDKLLPNLEDDSQLFTVLSPISDLAEGILTGAVNFFATQNASTQNDANTKIDKGITEVRTLRASRVNDVVFEARRLFAEFHAGAGAVSDHQLREYNTQLSAFREAYDSFLNSHSKGDLLRLVLVSSRLVASMKSDREMLRLVRENLLEQASSEGMDEISVFFDRPLSIDEIAEKLKSLVELYALCCGIAGVSEHEHPLRPGKVESGSLWIRAIGSLLSIGLLRDALRFAMGFTYRNYTNEGQRRAAIQDRFEAIELMGVLADGLKERGQDDTEVRRRLKEGSESLASQLGTFVGDDHINIDGEKLKTARELPAPSQKLLPGNEA
jgi:hypothetical protein